MTESVKFIKRDGCESVKDVVLRNVGMSEAEFLKDVRDPYIKNLDEAVALTRQYLKDHPGGRITVVGDYDSDGINSAAILYWAFSALGVSVVLRLPRRFSEGYGLSPGIVDEIDEGLLITVDNGIAAAPAIQKAKDKGLTVIVTDHHLAPTDENGHKILPPADVIVDPAVEEDSEFHDFCGAVLAYRFAKELLPGKLLKPLLTLASIATVTDVMPLVGANRTLVKDGLAAVHSGSAVPGLAYLMREMKLDPATITEEDYGFAIGPAFNAAGRLYDNGAEKVLRVLTSKWTDARLPWRTAALVKTNEERKALVRESMKQVQTMLTPERPVVLFDPDFHEGIIGILAGRICEDRGCPAIVFTRSEKQGILKGSGRSIPEIHLKQVLDRIAQSTDCIAGYGGHAGAAGLSIFEAKLPEFQQAFAKEVGTLPESDGIVSYDLELNRLLIPDIIEELNAFAPFGEGNPRPVFHLFYDAKKENASYQLMGDTRSHFSLRGENLTLTGFHLADKYERMGRPERIECVGNLSQSWYQGKMSVVFQILDLKAA